MKLRTANLVLLVIIGSLLLPVASFAAQPAAPAGNNNLQQLRNILAKPLARLHKASWRASGRLVQIDAAGKRTTYNIALKVLGAPTTMHVLLDISGPNKTRTRVLLVTHNGLTTIQIAHPGDHAPTAVPYDQWVNGPVGTSFSYEDFVEAQYSWHGQQVQPDQKLGVRECDVLESTPGSGDRTHYAEVKTWLDHAIGFPVYVEKTVKGTGTVKQYTYYGLRQNGGVWSATQVEAKLRGDSGTSLLILDRGTPNAKLDLSEFDAVKLTQF